VQDSVLRILVFISITGVYNMLQQKKGKHFVACSPLPDSNREENTFPRQRVQCNNREQLETVFPTRSVPRGYQWDKFRVQFNCETVASRQRRERGS
jgi:ssDNA-binding Zn-finger/Zn-ribbon topoisomerase 1